MKNRTALLASLMALLLVLEASTNLLPGAKAQAGPQNNDSPTEKAFKSSGMVQAIIELDGPPVVERMKAHAPAAQPNRRINLESVESQAYEAQVESEQANFKSRAALISPALRVRTELRTLANAVSIEAPGTEVAAIAALPGVKRVEIIKEYHAML